MPASAPRCDDAPDRTVDGESQDAARTRFTEKRCKMPNSGEWASPLCQTVRRYGRRQLRQRDGRDDQRPLQERTHLPTGTVEGTRRRRIRHPRMDRLVQPPPDPRTDRRHPTCRIRNQLPPSNQPSRHGRTQTKLGTDQSLHYSQGEPHGHDPMGSRRDPNSPGSVGETSASLQDL